MLPFLHIALCKLRRLFTVHGQKNEKDKLSYRELYITVYAILRYNILKLRWTFVHLQWFSHETACKFCLKASTTLPRLCLPLWLVLPFRKNMKQGVKKAKRTMDHQSIPLLNKSTLVSVSNHESRTWIQNKFPPIMRISWFQIINLVVYFLVPSSEKVEVLTISSQRVIEEIYLKRYPECLCLFTIHTLAGFYT
jgi:hypothetical protein